MQMETVARCFSTWLVLGLALCFSDGAPGSHKPTLLLVSFDGFRWDYLTKTDTPNFDRITKNGVQAKWIQDTFTSLTFPNHYTIVTGMYEESHGIIANTFYDPVFDEVFDINDRTTVQDGKFWGGEPIWVTNQLQGGRTGVYYWVGSEAEIKGVRPDIWKPYENKNASMERWVNRTDTVIQWLTDPEVMVDLALLYFKEPDGTGHHYGPDSPELVEMVQQCDNITGYLLDRLEEHNVLGKLNIIITSDHGMTSMNRSRFITLDDHIDETKAKHLLNYVVGTSVWPKNEEATDELYKNLSHINDHVAVWRKEEIPPEYHYSDNVRVSPILLSANEGWGIKQNWSDKHYLLGRHGFNNSKMDMHPFFIATGPAFKKGYVSEPFENIHIYELMCHILGVKPAPNNGTFSAVAHLLVADAGSGSDPEDETQYVIAKWAGLSVALVIVIGFLAYIFKEVAMKPKGKNYRNNNNDYPEFDELDAEALLLASSV